MSFECLLKTQPAPSMSLWKKVAIESVAGEFCRLRGGGAVWTPTLEGSIFLRVRRQICSFHKVKLPTSAQGLCEVAECGPRPSLPWVQHG